MGKDEKEFPVKLNILSGIISGMLIFLVRVYQYIISPWFPPACRHEPSCSRYAVDALKLHGPVNGLKLSFKRLSRCHPWGKWGYDPVPHVAVKHKPRD